MKKILIALSVCVLVGADAPTDVVKKELAKLEGEWSMVSGERDGNKIPDEFAKTGKRVAKGDETTVTFGDMLFMKAKVTLDPAKKPKTIVYKVSDGMNKGKTQLGIYELDGDTLKFCFAPPDKERPDDFTAKEGSGRILSVWKRNKK